MRLMKKIFLFFVFILFLMNPSYANAQEGASASSAKIQKLNVLQPDYRVRILKDYLNQYNSPLASYSAVFIRNADDYDIDWRLVAAISGIESTFGHQIPYNTYNAWGWGIYGDNMLYFKSWEDGIETISKGLRENYINKWKAQNVYEIGRIYAASPTWALRVDYFMQRIQEFGLRNPQSALSLSL